MVLEYSVTVMQPIIWGYKPQICSFQPKILCLSTYIFYFKTAKYEFETFNYYFKTVNDEFWTYNYRCDINLKAPQKSWRANLFILVLRFLLAGLENRREDWVLVACLLVFRFQMLWFRIDVGNFVANYSLWTGQGIEFKNWVLIWMRTQMAWCWKLTQWAWAIAIVRGTKYPENTKIIQKHEGRQ